MPLENHDVERLLLEIENRNGKCFYDRRFVISIIKISCLGGMADSFNRLILLGKFLHNTNNIMNRIGKEGEGYKKLLSEFMDHTNEVLYILKKIIAAASEEIRNELKSYLNLQMESDFKNFIKLMEDLSLLKNFELDTNRKLCEEFK
jgi:hypothetical protein